MRQTFLVIAMLLAGGATGLSTVAPTTDAFAQGAAGGGNGENGGNGGGNGGGPCIGPNCVPPPDWPSDHPCNSGGADCGVEQLNALMDCLCTTGGQESCGGYRPVNVDVAEFCGRR